MEALSVGRVTAGLPALTPSLRFETDRRIRHRAKQIAIDTEVERKRDDAVAPDGDTTRTEYAACLGTPLHSYEIMRRLTALNPSIWFQRNEFRPVMQIWVRDNSPAGKRFVCGFEAELSPEKTVVLWHSEEHVKGHGKDAHLVTVKVADDVVRGWLDVLKTLIQEKIITAAGALRMFGTVDARRWQEKGLNA